jgi:hypothetical protein
MLESASSVFEVAEAAQYLVWTLQNVPYGAFDSCCNGLQRAFEISPGVPIRLVRHGTTATIYPGGVKLLDEAVIESNLIWLSKYPDVRKPFEEALKFYLAKDANQYRNMLDNLRFALEQMLRVVLKNQKSLENQKDEFLRWLNRHDIHGRIGNMYHDLLFGGFAGYQNDAVKHQENKYTAAEIEFVLYATGTFLRLIQRLAEQEAATRLTATVS